jgi:hypothetical protein
MLRTSCLKQRCRTGARVVLCCVNSGCPHADVTALYGWWALCKGRVTRHLFVQAVTNIM